MTAIFMGNVTARSRRNRIQGVPVGFDLFSLLGTARLTNVAANNWDILDDADGPLTVLATAGDPAWVMAVSARIDLNNQTLAGTNGDVLKIGQSVTDVVFPANSTAVAAALLGAQAIRTAQNPNAIQVLTANVTYRAFLHNGSNVAPGGNLTVVPGVASGLLAAGRNFIRVPVEILYLRRSQAISMADIPALSPAQQRLDGGII